MKNQDQLSRKYFTMANGITVIERDYSCADFKYEILKEEIEKFPK